MLVGHLGVGFAAKRLQPSISLGTWMLAALLADLICFPLLIAGVERFSGGQASIPYSHSLLMDLMWGTLAGGLFFLWRRNARGAWLLAGAVVSHWVLDVVSHRPDMQLMPGMATRFGLGLWNSIPATLIVEGGLWVAGIVVYLRTAKSRGRTGVIAFWAGVVLWTLAWSGNIRRGMDPDPVKAGVGGLIFFALLILWAYWMNATRAPRAA